MLQLTLHTQIPCPTLATSIRDSYLELRARNDPRYREGCLSITMLDLGPSKQARHRALFERVGATGSSLRVVTEAADMLAALRSGFAVLQGSCAAFVPPAPERSAFGHAAQLAPALAPL